VSQKPLAVEEKRYEIKANIFRTLPEAKRNVRLELSGWRPDFLLEHEVLRRHSSNPGLDFSPSGYGDCIQKKGLNGAQTILVLNK
jgi:hypothetical protein